MLTKDLFAGTLQAILVFSFLNALFDADVVLNCSLSHSLSTVLISAGHESILSLVPLTALERDRGLLRLKTGLLRCHSFSQWDLSLMEELCPCRCSSRMSRAVLPGRSERQQKAFRSEPSRALTAVSFSPDVLEAFPTGHWQDMGTSGFPTATRCGQPRSAWR